MPPNRTDEDKSKLVYYDGMLASELLRRQSLAEKAQTLKEAAQKITVRQRPGRYLLAQSEGYSDYSMLINTAYTLIIDDYQLATACDWTKTLVALHGEAETDEEKFERLANQWRESRGPTSSVTQMAMHPAYQQIMGMGKAAIPLILKELAREPDHWFWALKAISGVDPVPQESRGDLSAMAEAWLNWGRKEGYIEA
jgi:hypothetical protein